jgi:chemotaxis protein CheX
MDIKHVDPFLVSFDTVMKQLGFRDVQTVNAYAKDKELTASGIILMVGIVGDIKGNIAYVIGMEEAKKIASSMMMGMPVEELDPMSRSAISELANMLSAHAATNFSKSGILIDISTPTFVQGKNISINMSSANVLCLEFTADGLPMEVNVSFDKL